MTTFLVGDVRDQLATLPDQSVQCVVTSPPYWGLRDYGVAGQMGLESTPDEYVAMLVGVFRLVWRVLRDDGTVFLNLGDSYAGSWGAQSREHAGKHAPNVSALSANQAAAIRASGTGSLSRTPGLKNKDLVGIPWMVAFALRADGWWLRSDIVWDKPNPMPESVQDRPTRSHEYVFLLTKAKKYFYDSKAIRNEPSAALLKQIAEGYNGTATKDYASAGAQDPSDVKARIIANKQRGHGRRHEGLNGRWDAMTKEEQTALGSNARSVWRISPQPYRGAHFATMPEKLADKCVRAGSRPGDVVLDPFGGSGTTAAVANRLGRQAILIELNPAYVELAKARVANVRA